MNTYPVTFEMDYVERRSRLTTFFRWFLALPHFVFFYGYAIAFFFVYVFSWFALMFTGCFPEGAYRFASGFLRYITRLNAYLLFGVDTYPPFNGADDDSYPVRVHIGPPLDRYSRLKVFFRGWYAIVALIIRYALTIVMGFVSFLSWFAIVVTGRQPKTLWNALRFGMSYTTQADALLFLITETYPPFGEDEIPSAEPAT